VISAMGDSYVSFFNLRPSHLHAEFPQEKILWEHDCVYPEACEFAY